jgi:hypothetical protein
MKKLKPHAVDWTQIERFLASADKKLASAHKILAFDEEACLQQAYEAMLKASLGFMFANTVSLGNTGLSDGGIGIRKGIKQPDVISAAVYREDFGWGGRIRMHTSKFQVSPSSCNRAFSGTEFLPVQSPRPTRRIMAAKRGSERSGS